ncbi:heavy metal translocating P-type ATPase [Pseudobacteriovorax antillogorgiicola]|uniref:ATPase, P-type (Transporting), HAD superfamily, subfamily IC n=2 Tax=Pseudobacteriovorax antillogorgiicola TaxID=1513793 RepID=A0A1Y6BIT5_9BACT|nr:heavy metal translocating P-type ATPase metal-binding domain-containing protein [Pseudobacteriovorax antillogorgiicola]TCS56407.1 P-type E1-E2 ATPase [Pseudobacteriovorax antillogorgiicola]SMF05950.1 ATPase, P-type (transporting), HAD superfamily, subfamily IC [Pseudobacteriovorax antillogorgiicola]
MHVLVQEQSPSNQQVKCQHCDTLLSFGSTSDFCCHGCETAYNFIRKLHLDDYYRLLKEKNATPLLGKEARQYDFLDHRDFQESFSEPTSDDRRIAHLYLKNLECYACIWVCEKALKKTHPEVSISLNMAERKAQISFDPKTDTLSSIAGVLDQLGYPVAPDQNFHEDDKTPLIRMGLAFFCLMNIMLLSTIEYLGSDLEGSIFFHLFRYISMGLATLAIAVPGRSFYQNTIQAFKRKTLHLDFPISLALLTSFLYSSYNTMQGSGPVFFDSMVAIIFLLLLGRYIQSQVLKKHHRQMATETFQSKLVRILDSSDSNKFKDTHRLIKGDRIRVMPGDIVPVKGKLLSSEAHINLEFMTGEQNFLAKRKGETLASGSTNLDHPIDLECLEDGTQSDLYQIESGSERLLQQKGQTLVTSEKIARFLILFILIVASMVFIYHLPNWDIAISRTVTTLLIACPCAFGLGAPLIIARALQLGLQQQLLFRNQKGIELLPRIDTFFFDKTGTLTQTACRAELKHHDPAVASITSLAAVLQELKNYSSHHMIQSMSLWASQRSPSGAVISDFKETIGQGVSFTFEGSEVRIGRAEFCKAPSDLDCDFTFVSRDHEIWAQFDLEEALQLGAHELIEGLQKHKKQVHVLSGDREDRVSAINKSLAIESRAGQARLKPQDKMDTIDQNSSLSAMVGNGINDSLAMARSTLSIAVQDSSDQAKACSDILLLSPNLRAIYEGFKIAKACQKAFYRGFSFAITFNILGISLGATGYLSPVVAAILMPISSLTVIYLSTSWEAK